MLVLIILRKTLKNSPKPAIIIPLKAITARQCSIINGMNCRRKGLEKDGKEAIIEGKV
jgi:hypothetical protein